MKDCKKKLQEKSLDTYKKQIGYFAHLSPPPPATEESWDQCCGSRSGIRCLFDPWIRNRFFPDPGSWIPDPVSQTPCFWEHSDNFLGEKFSNSLKIGPNFFLQHFKNKIIYNFVKFTATKKGMTTHPSLLLLFLDPGSGIGKNQDPESGINIPDPQHWLRQVTWCRKQHNNERTHICHECNKGFFKSSCLAVRIL